jgi:hypothetical protein
VITNRGSNAVLLIGNAITALATGAAGNFADALWRAIWRIATFYWREV